MKYLIALLLSPLLTIFLMPILWKVNAPEFGVVAEYAMTITYFFYWGLVLLVFYKWRSK